jgi:hypothetical protein
MLAELAIRFVLGGVVVSLFAAAAEMFEPKTFAGIFGAAPSVALAALGLAYAKHDGRYVATEGQSMIIGAVALLAYSAACVAVTRRKEIPVWAGAGAAWAVWLVIAFGLWALLSVMGVLS